MTELTKEWLLKTTAELEEERDSMLGVVNSAFRHDLQHDFSLGQTDNQAGF